MRGPNMDVNVTIPVNGVPLKVGLPKELWRGVTRSMRYKFATWKWLQPNEPCRTLRDLPQVQEAAGLDHVDRQTFATRLIDACKEIIRLHPELRRWVEYRIAALEYWADPPKPTDRRLVDSADTLRNTLWRTQHRASQDPARGLFRLEQVAYQAMHAAAISVTQALGVEGGSRVSGNLMVPLSTFDWIKAGENWNAAARLWDGLDTSKRLVIVAETEGSTHTGFWVPTVRGERWNRASGRPYGIRPPRGRCHL